MTGPAEEVILSGAQRSRRIRNPRPFPRRGGSSVGRRIRATPYKEFGQVHRPSEHKGGHRGRFSVWRTRLRNRNALRSTQRTVPRVGTACGHPMTAPTGTGGRIAATSVRTGLAMTIWGRFSLGRAANDRPCKESRGALDVRRYRWCCVRALELEESRSMTAPTSCRRPRTGT